MYVDGVLVYVRVVCVRLLCVVRGALEQALVSVRGANGARAPAAAVTAVRSRSARPRLSLRPEDELVASASSSSFINLIVGPEKDGGLRQESSSVRARVIAGRLRLIKGK